MAYIYLSNRKLRSSLNAFCVNKINNVQKSLHKRLTFQYFLIGSGCTKLLTINGKSKHVDLDYNLVIQSCEEDLIRHPEHLKNMFVNAFNDSLKVCKNVKVHNSTSVITSYVGDLLGYHFSFDCAIMYSLDGNHLYKLTKNGGNSYSWNKIKKSKNFQARFKNVKKNHLNELLYKYLSKKNEFNGKDSFSLLLETINELEQKHGLR